MQFHLDFRSGVPSYAQIVEQVRQKVAGGELRQGDQLPTVRLLATDLRVNFNTVARAYRLLDEAGLISTQRGRGTYIWEQPSDETLQKLRREGLQGLTHHYLSEAARLGFNPADVQEAVSAGLSAWQNGSQPNEEEGVFP
jgi:GntR family transcriptional regulator